MFLACFHLEGLSVMRRKNVYFKLWHGLKANLCWALLLWRMLKEFAGGFSSCLRCKEETDEKRVERWHDERNHCQVWTLFSFLSCLNCTNFISRGNRKLQQISFKYLLLRHDGSLSPARTDHLACIRLHLFSNEHVGTAFPNNIGTFHARRHWSG